jgi:hypothetical protein
LPEAGIVCILIFLLLLLLMSVRAVVMPRYVCIVPF